MILAYFMGGKIWFSYIFFTNWEKIAEKRQNLLKFSGFCICLNIEKMEFWWKLDLCNNKLNVLGKNDEFRCLPIPKKNNYKELSSFN